MVAGSGTAVDDILKSSMNAAGSGFCVLIILRAEKTPRTNNVPAGAVAPTVYKCAFQPLLLLPAVKVGPTFVVALPRTPLPRLLSLSNSIFSNVCVGEFAT